MRVGSIGHGMEGILGGILPALDKANHSELDLILIDLILSRASSNGR